MGNRVTKESMEFIAGEIMDAVLASDSLEDGINSMLSLVIRLPICLLLISLNADTLRASFY